MFLPSTEGLRHESFFNGSRSAYQLLHEQENAHQTNRSLSNKTEHTSPTTPAIEPETPTLEEIQSVVENIPEVIENGVTIPKSIQSIQTNEILPDGQSQEQTSHTDENEIMQTVIITNPYESTSALTPEE